MNLRASGPEMCIYAIQEDPQLLYSYIIIRIYLELFSIVVYISQALPCDAFFCTFYLVSLPTNSHCKRWGYHLIFNDQWWCPTMGHLIQLANIPYVWLVYTHEIPPQSRQEALNFLRPLEKPWQLWYRTPGPTEASAEQLPPGGWATHLTNRLVIEDQHDKSGWNMLKLKNMWGHQWVIVPPTWK